MVAAQAQGTTKKTAINAFRPEEVHPPELVFGDFSSVHEPPQASLLLNLIAIFLVSVVTLKCT
jgi:hypothetical protein